MEPNILKLISLSLVENMYLLLNENKFHNQIEQPILEQMRCLLLFKPYCSLECNAIGEISYNNKMLYISYNNNIFPIIWKSIKTEYLNGNLTDECMFALSALRRLIIYRIILTITQKFISTCYIEKGSYTPLSDYDFTYVMYHEPLETLRIVSKFNKKFNNLFEYNSNIIFDANFFVCTTIIDNACYNLIDNNINLFFKQINSNVYQLYYNDKHKYTSYNITYEYFDYMLIFYELKQKIKSNHSPNSPFCFNSNFNIYCNKFYTKLHTFSNSKSKLKYNTSFDLNIDTLSNMHISSPSHNNNLLATPRHSEVTTYSPSIRKTIITIEILVKTISETSINIDTDLTNDYNGLLTPINNKSITKSNNIKPLSSTQPSRSAKLSTLHKIYLPTITTICNKQKHNINDDILELRYYLLQLFKNSKDAYLFDGTLKYIIYDIKLTKYIDILLACLDNICFIYSNIKSTTFPPIVNTDLFKTINDFNIYAKISKHIPIIDILHIINNISKYYNRLHHIISLLTRYPYYYSSKYILLSQICDYWINHIRNKISIYDLLYNCSKYEKILYDIQKLYIVHIHSSISKSITNRFIEFMNDLNVNITNAIDIFLSYKKHKKYIKLFINSLIKIE